MNLVKTKKVCIGRLFIGLWPLLRSVFMEANLLILSKMQDLKFRLH